MTGGLLDVTASPWEWAARRFEPHVRRYSTPGDLARAVDVKTGKSPALDLIDAELVDLINVNSDHDALMVEMPPQEGKSQRVSRRFPEWLLDDDPSLRIAIVSYEQEMALRWGRDIKQDITLSTDGALSIGIRRDSTAAGRWETPEGGGVYCVGIGGPLTGRPVDVLLIDDPVKDRAAAESRLIRESTWDWWESVALTRLAPGGKVVLIQCMTGDTPVLMGDGTEKPLADVRPGDTVATYETGRVTTATVRNWTNQGPDSVFRIRMRSGRVVRANARHPFLTVDAQGAETWQRTDTLRPGSRILSVTGVSGAMSPAPAASPRDAQGVTARDCATPATTSSDGPTGYARRPSTVRRAGRRIFGTATASAGLTMTGCSPSKAASALSASAPTGSLPTGTLRFASITATPPAASGDCSATTATLSSGTPRQKQLCRPQPTTYAIELDEVAEIVPCGVADVYDLQIDRTENFIAAGLAAHNTRWHEDDLAGRILSRPSPLRWREVKIPAIATGSDDPLGRVKGQELQSVRGRAPGHFRNLQATMSPYVFSGVYQQSPTAPEGNFFRRATFRYWRPAPPWPGDMRERIDCEGQLVTLADAWTFGTVDVAASTKTSADYTVIAAWAISLAGDLILLDRARARVPEHDHFSLAKPLIARWGLSTLYVESHFFATTLVDDARAAGVPVAPLIADTDKVTRAIPAAGRIHAGRVWFPAETSGCDCGNCPNGVWLDEWTDELAIFPAGAHDDQVDVLAYAARIQSHEWTPARQPARPEPTPHERAIAIAAKSATGNAGDGHGDIDLMNVQY